MKPQFFIAILFATSLYWMYLLYAPFLLVITIAALLAVSTTNIQEYFERLFGHKFLAAFISSLLLAVLFFAPLGYFLATLTIQLNSIEPEMVGKIEVYVKNFLETPPSYLVFLKPYLVDAMRDVNINTITAYALGVEGQVGVQAF